jgi:hypothetical protein
MAAGVNTSDAASVVTVKRDVKLTAPPGFRLPDLGGLLPGTKPLAERLIDATYYDTGDLRLARAGITVRYRSDEPGPAWTVELPVADRGRAPARREISFAGPPGHVPGAAADLVLAVKRARRLEPVAHLAIVRRPVELATATANSWPRSPATPSPPASERAATPCPKLTLRAPPCCCAVSARRPVPPAPQCWRPCAPPAPPMAQGTELNHPLTADRGGRENPRNPDLIIRSRHVTPRRALPQFWPERTAGRRRITLRGGGTATGCG